MTSDPWKDALIDALCCECILTEQNENDPRQAIRDLRRWNYKTALDPAISAAAKALVDRAEKAEAELLSLRAENEQRETDLGSSIEPTGDWLESQHCEMFPAGSRLQNLLVYNLVDVRRVVRKLRDSLAEHRTKLTALRDEQARLQAAIREHRDARGDDRCWMDDEALYRVLPEGYTPPARDSSVELHRCEQFIASRQNPATIYVSPQRRIEELEADLTALRAAQEPREKDRVIHSDGSEPLIERIAYREVLQAVLDAVKGTLDTSTNIADHPNVKFVQMQMLDRHAEHRIVASLAAMLGWENIPPQHIFEAEIRAMKARIQELATLTADHARLQPLLKQIERHCPCGARPESPKTHPHVGGCPVFEALELLAAADSPAPQEQG